MLTPLPLRNSRYSLDTVGVVGARDHELMATCQGCGRSSILDLADIIRRRGATWPRHRIKGRCRRCGALITAEMRPALPMIEIDPLTRVRPTPFKFAGRAEHMVDGDRVHYWCLRCGDRWALLQVDFLAHPMGGPRHILKDIWITACGGCGERSSISVRLEWVEP